MIQPYQKQEVEDILSRVKNENKPKVSIFVGNDRLPCHDFCVISEKFKKVSVSNKGDFFLEPLVESVSTSPAVIEPTPSLLVIFLTVMMTRKQH